MEHRYSKRVTAGVKLLIYKKGIPVAIGRIKDVSRHGIFVSTDFTDVGLHQILEIEFTLQSDDGGQRSRFRAVVARKAEGGIGLELEEGSDEGYEALRSLVDRVASQPIFGVSPLVSNA